jgi:hypothetical protein
MNQAVPDVTAPQSGLHRLLLALAGQLPVEVVVRARKSLAAGDVVAAAAAVAEAAEEVAGLSVSATQASLLREVLTDHPAAGALEDLEVSDEPPMPVHQFSPTGPADLPAGSPPLMQTLDLTSATRALIRPDAADSAMIALASGVPGAKGLWRTWRFDPIGGDPPVRIYLVEVANGPEVADHRLPELAAEAQSALTAFDPVPPQVEVYRSGEEIPPYHQYARMWSALVWAAAPVQEIQLARVFDRADPVTGPAFDPDHPTVGDPEERRRILDHLDAGLMLMSTMSTMDDVVSPERFNAVPLNFRTDGRWIWTDAVAYYLAEYHLAPDADLLDHIRSGPAPAELDSVDVHRALAYLQAPEEDVVWSLDDPGARD